MQYTLDTELLHDAELTGPISEVKVKPESLHLRQA